MIKRTRYKAIAACQRH